MLKKICGLFLGLVVLTSSACVTPTYASSALSGGDLASGNGVLGGSYIEASQSSKVILVEIRAGGEAGAKDELVVLYNNSPTEQELTNWCLTNKSNVAFSCFNTNNPSQAIFLPGYSYGLVASSTHLISTDPNLLEADFAKIYVVTNQSSGSIVASSDTISLIDNNQQVVDSYSWSQIAPTGKVLLRAKISSQPDIYSVAEANESWGYQTAPDDNHNQTYLKAIDANTVDDSELLSNIHPIISELLPNNTGRDIGQEFIELYNPSDQLINLADYKLLIGDDTKRSYNFPEGSVVGPGGYQAFNNSQIGFTLVNTKSSVALEYLDNLILPSIDYQSPPEAQSWALINGVWQYTNQPTSGLPNIQSVTTAKVDSNKSPKSSKLKTSSAPKYATAKSSNSTNLKPCEAGEYRNPETNRCKKITSTADSTLKACDKGQERNPETNRCRTVKQITDVKYGVQGVAVESKQTAVNWYMWAGIGAVVLAILVYGIFEWKSEILTLTTKVRQSVVKKFARKKH